jgi:hypothetical protein
MISFGGSDSGSQQQQSSSQGFRDLPPEIQNAFKDLAVQAQGYLPGNNAATSEMFTPLAQTAGETQAINNINQGFTPNQTQLNSDIAMQMNPFDESVISEINRQATGQNSALNRTMANAGQFGSNRMALGANDIDLSRLNQIGTFKQGQYNTAMNNALTVLPQNRLSDANAQLSAGGFQRTLNNQTKQAPVNALASISQILGVLPTNSGQSSGSGGSSSSGYNFGLFSSDRSLKENIVRVGEEKGFNLYRFNYKGQEKSYVGVMADEVESINPKAVRMLNGFKAVDYGMIGIPFREVA